MNDNILDQEERKLEEHKGRKRISGLSRFALVLYLFYNTYLGLPSLIVFAGEPIGLFIGMILIFMTCWYNIQQGRYELTDKLINQSFFRYCSIFTFALLILFYVGVFINRLNTSILSTIDVVFILGILVFLTYRDVFRIPKEIAHSNFEN